MTRGAKAGDAPLSRVLAGASEPAAHPVLHFRAMPPSEALIALAREQDTLCRAVLRIDAPASRVVIERDTSEATSMHDVLVRSRVLGTERCGRARHADARTALREAYTQLLRSPARVTPCPCSAAA